MSDTFTVKDDRKTGVWWAENEVFDFGISHYIGVSALVVYLALIRHANKHGEAHPSVPRLEQECSLSNRVIAGSVAKLQKVGLIDVKRVNHQRNVYHVHNVSKVAEKQGWQRITTQNKPAPKHVTKSHELPKAGDEKSRATHELVTKSHELPKAGDEKSPDLPKAGDEKSPELVTNSHAKEYPLKDKERLLDSDSTVVVGGGPGEPSQRPDANDLPCASPNGESPPQKPSRKVQGARLAPDWTLPPEWNQWAVGYCRQNDKALDVAEEADKFADYFHAKAGPDGRKLDWEATWRNWIRNAHSKYNGKRNSKSQDIFRSYL